MLAQESGFRMLGAGQCGQNSCFARKGRLHIGQSLSFTKLEYQKITKKIMRAMFEFLDEYAYVYPNQAVQDKPAFKFPFHET
jgi:hypothetical protein